MKDRNSSPAVASCTPSALPDMAGDPDAVGAQVPYSTGHTAAEVPPIAVRPMAVARTRFTLGRRHRKNSGFSCYRASTFGG